MVVGESDFPSDQTQSSISAYNASKVDRQSRAEAAVLRFRDDVGVLVGDMVHGDLEKLSVGDVVVVRSGRNVSSKGQPEATA